MKFLVVDDDAAICDLLSKILHHLGYPDVSVAASAQEALSLIDKSVEPYQCILLDIQMPGMDGVELCHILRRKEAYRDVPIVMLTAMSERHYLDRAFRNGATDYIQKPFEVDDLGVRIGVAIKLSASQAELRALKMTDASEVAPNKPACEARVRFEDAVILDDAPKAIKYLNFEKYVLALPMLEIVSTSAIGIRVAGLEEIHAEVSEAEFLRLLNLTADCIDSAQSETGPLYTYAGSGVFLMLRMRGEPFYAESLIENFVRTVRTDAQDIVGPSLAQRLDIQIGAPVRLWTLRRQDRLISLRKATTNVLDAQNIRKNSDGPSRESEYRSLLEDFDSDLHGPSALRSKSRKNNNKFPAATLPRN